MSCLPLPPSVFLVSVGSPRRLMTSFSGMSNFTLSKFSLVNLVFSPLSPFLSSPFLSLPDLSPLEPVSIRPTASTSSTDVLPIERNQLDIAFPPARVNVARKVAAEGRALPVQGTDPPHPSMVGTGEHGMNISAVVVLQEYCHHSPAQVSA